MFQLNKKTAIAGCFLFAILLLWQISVRESFLLPTPTKILKAFVSLLQYPATWQNIFNTTIRVYASLALSILIGIPLGILVFFDENLTAMAEVILQPIQYIASAVISIISIVLFGLSPITPYFVITIAILPNIYIATQLGLKEIRKDYLELGQMYTDNKFRLFKYIVFPQLIPYIAVGVVRSNAIAWKIAITAEVFIAVSGLGFMINHYYKLLNTPKLFATVLIIILVGILFDKLIKMLKTKIFINYETVSLD